MLKLSLDEERLILRALEELHWNNQTEYLEIATLYKKMNLHILEVERMMAECELK